MLKRFVVLMVASFCIVGLLAACGGSSSSSTASSGGSTSGGSASQTIDMTEMKFTPNTFTVKAGEKVTVKLDNKGTVTHDFSIDSLKIAQTVAAGKSATVTFTAPTTAGSLVFYCNQPGHEAAGMKGTITVQ
jgi:nitrite reductase (NO-forming)